MSIEGECALLMAEERSRDLAWVKDLLNRYGPNEALSPEDAEELRQCQVRQFMRRDAGYR